MAQCMYPYSVERKLYTSQETKYVQVPCGKCPECLKRRTASWAHRLEMESKRWPTMYFITLTYSNETVPITNNGFLTLRPKDLTDFWKRLRKRCGKLKYYACGEYGSRTKRPHYHAIVFCSHGIFEDDIVQSWPFGLIHFGDVTPASIRYTVQYYDKGEWQPQHKRDDRVPEFSRMSQGIGSNFLSEKMAEHFLARPDKGYIYDFEGRKISIPRYYKKRLYDFSISTNLVANHPSILLHRDDMLEAKKVYLKEMERIANEQEVIEEDEELREARKWAIINYKEKKRKTRKN